MKTKLIHILGAFLIALFATSCEDWLDVTSSSEIKAEDQFKQEAGFKDALMGCYIGMTSPNLYARDMTWNIVDLLSQQYATLSSLAVYEEMQQFEYETATASSQIESMWTKMYTVIANVNNELTYLEKNKEVLEEVNHDIIKGELLGLRAFLHFDLMRLFGYGNLAQRSDLSDKAAIPYVQSYDKNLTPQLSYDQTFELMITDLDEALALLKQDPIYENATRDDDYYDVINEDGFYDDRENRMNYYAVLALKARVLLWQGGIENITAAGEAAEEVINHSSAHLINSETYPITSDPVLYSEHLFDLNVTAFEDIVDVFLDAAEATDYNSLYIPFTSAEELYETSNSNIGAVDIRFNTLLEDQLSGKVCVKLRQGSQGTNNDSHPNMMPLIKLPEMYYIAAESYMKREVPDLSKAIGYLNEVRGSRGIIEEIPAETDMTLLNDELFKEYRKEFVSEGQLFFYYKRIGMDFIPGYSGVTAVDDDIYVLPYPDSETLFGRKQ